jgi:hypothetical protein
MSSQDTMQMANAERQKAQDLQAQAQRVMDTAQQQATKYNSDADIHMSEAQRLDDKAQAEQQQEAQDAAEQARKEQEKQDNGGVSGLFG